MGAEDASNRVATGRPVIRCMARSEQRAGGKVGAAHQVLVDAARALAPFPDRPHHQRLAAPGIAAGEDAGHAAHVVVVRADVAALVGLDTEVLDRTLFRTEEPE